MRKREEDALITFHLPLPMKTKFVDKCRDMDTLPSPILRRMIKEFLKEKIK